MLFRGTQIDKEIKGGVDGIVNAGGRAVDFVDDDNCLQPFVERLAQDKAGLGHGAFNGVNKQ